MAADDFTTLAEVKAWLGIDSGDTTQDTQLGALITAVSADIRTFTNRDIYPVKSYAAMINGNGRQAIVLPNDPITAVALLKVNGADIPARQDVTGSGYVFDGAAIHLSGYTFTQGVKNVQISYSAGRAAIPGDIGRAALEWAGWRYREKQHIGISSKGIGPESVSFANTSNSMPESAELILKQWQRVFQVST